jgi:glutaredoxin
LFAGLNAQVLGISVDHVPCLQAWAQSLGGISYPLLSDFWPHGAVSAQYDVLRQTEGFTERAIFIIDKFGIIRYIDVHDIADQPDNEEIRRVLASLEMENGTTPAISPLEENPAAWSAMELEDEPLPQGGIILYCARWCKDCKNAKAWLDEHGLAYQEVDIDYNQAARDQVRKWGNGFLITPTFDIEGDIVLDFDRAKLEETIRKHGIDQGRGLHS